jgi:hypothetical protein
VLNYVVARELNHPYTHSGEYPLKFNNVERLPFPPGCKKNLFEFPLLMTGPYIPHQHQPGLDRVIYTVKKRGNPTPK